MLLKELGQGFDPQAFDDVAMDDGERTPPAIRSREKGFGAADRVAARADAHGIPARPESCSGAGPHACCDEDNATSIPGKVTGLLRIETSAMTPANGRIAVEARLSWI